MELAKKFKNDKEIGIGAIDCDLERNKCAQYGVNGYPALKAIILGKGKSYNGARETGPMEQWITQVAKSKGTKGGSSKCRVGMFKSKMKHAVVPLCEAHFPDQKAKNDWLILFYDHTATEATRDAFNSVAIDFGNDPPDMNKALKKLKKKRDRIESLATKNDLKVNLPSKGPYGMDELAKVGGVCCDCDEEHTAFCASALKQGEVDFKPPQLFWVSKGKMEMLKDVELSSKGATGAVFDKLGFVAAPSAAGKTDL